MRCKESTEASDRIEANKHIERQILVQELLINYYNRLVKRVHKKTQRQEVNHERERDNVRQQ